MNYIWSKRYTSIKFGGGEEKKDKGKKKMKKERWKSMVEIVQRAKQVILHKIQRILI